MPAFILIGFMVLEIAGFVIVGDAVGVLMTLLLVFAAFVGGIHLLRHQGLDAMARARGYAPQNDVGVLEQAMRDMTVVLAAFLLMLPGFFSDLIALALLIPHVRSLVARRAAAMPSTSTRFYSYMHRADGGNDTRTHDGHAPMRTIDAEFVDLDAEKPAETDKKTLP